MIMWQSFNTISHPQIKQMTNAILLMSMTYWNIIAIEAIRASVRKARDMNSQSIH